MAVNRDKPDRWKDDIARSVDMYNDWFMRFAPQAYRTTRVQTTKDVMATLEATKNMTAIGVNLLKASPAVLPTLRMSTCPPLAVDRLIGLAGISPNLVKVMEKQGKLSPRMSQQALDTDLEKIGRTIREMADLDIFVWLGRSRTPSRQEVYRAATVVADRLCGDEPIAWNLWPGGRCATSCFYAGISTAGIWAMKRRKALTGCGSTASRILRGMGCS